jgi:hypothetical protein
MQVLDERDGLAAEVREMNRQVLRQLLEPALPLALRALHRTFRTHRHTLSRAQARHPCALTRVHRHRCPRLIGWRPPSGHTAAALPLAWVHAIPPGPVVAGLRHGCGGEATCSQRTQRRRPAAVLHEASGQARAHRHEKQAVHRCVRCTLRSACGAMPEGVVRSCVRLCVGIP